MSLPLCKDCVSGSTKEGVPTGRVDTIHGLPTYVAEPDGEPKGIVVIISDAFGWEFVNNRILTDSYAKKGGFKVLLPEFMDGHAVSTDVLPHMETFEDKSLWLYQKIPAILSMIPVFAEQVWYNRPPTARPRVEAFFRALRASTTLPIGAAGFCWGGKFVTQLCSGEPRVEGSDKPVLDCGFVAHPSRLAIPEEIEAVKLPLSFAHAGQDMMMSAEQAKTVQGVFDQKKGAVDTEFVVYEGVRHGFGVRIRGDDEKEVKAAADAEEQALKWFGKHLSKKS